MSTPNNCNRSQRIVPVASLAEALTLIRKEYYAKFPVPIRGTVISMSNQIRIPGKTKEVIVKDVYCTLADGTELQQDQVNVQFWGKPKGRHTSEKFFYNSDPILVEMYADVNFFLSLYSKAGVTPEHKDRLKPAVLLYDKDKITRGPCSQKIMLPIDHLDEVILKAYIIS